MAQGLQTFVITAAAACTLGACAHAGRGSELGELGDDLPGPKPAAAVAASLASVDTPVGSLCARPGARAVVERDLPGLTTRPEYMFFKHLTLRQLQAASNGRMSIADLQKVSGDLAAMPAEDRLAPAAAKPHKRPLLLRIASIL